MTIPNRNDVLTFDFGWSGRPLAEVLSRGTDPDPGFGWQGKPFAPAPSATPTAQLHAAGRLSVRAVNTLGGGAASQFITVSGRANICSLNTTVHNFTTWNSGDSVGNLALTPTSFITEGGPTTSAARARDGHDSGKFYIEFSTLVISFNSYSGYGFVTAGQSLTTWGSSGATNGFGSFLNADVRVNGSTIRSSGLSPSIQGGIGYAVDLDAKLFWVRRLSPLGDWLGPMTGAADPATGTNGFDFSAITSAIYPVVYDYGGGKTRVDMAFGDGPMVTVAPSGFMQGWPRNDVGAYTLARGHIAVRAKTTFAVITGTALASNGRLAVRSRSTAIAFNATTAFVALGRVNVRSLSPLAVAAFSSDLDSRGQFAVRSYADMINLAGEGGAIIIVVNP